jgi:cytochrome c
MIPPHKTHHRKNTLKLSLVAVFTLYPALGLADQALALKRQCMSCHQIEARRVGPPFKAIAQRYSANATAMAPVLARKIRSGSKGTWGQVGMPAMSQVSETEAQQLANWILGMY